MPPRTDLEQRQSKLSPAKQALLEEWSQGNLPSPATPQEIPQQARKDRVPPSFAQERLWFLNQLEPDSPAYNIVRAVRLSGPLDSAALEQSLNELVRRHETLRTTFSLEEGRPVQVINPELTLQLQLLDLRSLAETERESQAQRLCRERAFKTFDLTRGPLFRATLLCLGKREHILLLTMHHIVSDGWSMGILMREISALYQALAQGAPSPLPELPIQYADYALWQRQRLRGDTLEAQLTYWKQQLAGAPQVLELPTDHPRPPRQTYEGAMRSVTLSTALTLRLKALCQEESVTLFMTALAAFQILLYRYTGQVDIVVGSPIANRTRAELEGLVGFFVNTLILRTDLSGNPTFRELLGRVRDICLGAYAHQDLPFEQLVEALQPDRDSDHNPLFQTMLVYQNTPAQSLELPGLHANSMDIGIEAAQFDLTLLLTGQEDELQARMAYRTDLFGAPTIARMLGHFRTLLEDIVADPNQRIAQLRLLTRAEKQKLLVTWNNTQVDFGPDLCVHQLFERQVEQRPNALAVVAQDQQLCYCQLNRRANQMAHYLRGLGAGPEMPIGLFLKRSVERVVALLGILKAGAAFVTLDPAHPRQHLVLKVEDAEMSFIITTEALRERLPDSTARLICMDADQTTIHRESGQNPESAATSANLAYMVYTSGSTGRPKGVMIEHKALTNFLLAWYQYCKMGPHTHRLDNTSLSYDVWVASITIPLCCGGVLQLAPDEVLLPGPELIRFLEDTGVSQFTLVPSAFRLLPEAALPDLRLVITGGEVVTADLVERWAPGRTFLNGYGPTEATINTTVYPCTAGEETPSIGRPMANMQVYLLDAQLQPVPIGIPGELCIGGVGLARGYLNQPGLTADKFIPNPFGTEPGSRLYKTGDLARYRPDGNIDFLGRIDHQVKIRGSRIELEEIEAVLSQHPAVQPCVVSVSRDAQGAACLTAYVVPSQEHPPKPGELRRFLREKLPEQMVPSEIVLLDALPLTPSGKVDRNALPMLDWRRADAVQSYESPRTPVEETIAGIWAQTLGVDRAGIHDNFFDLGGHSLLATQVVAQIRDRLHVEVPLRVIFDSPTVADLATFIAEQQRLADAEQLDQIIADLEEMSDGKIERYLYEEGTETGENQR